MTITVEEGINVADSSLTQRSGLNSLQDLLVHTKTTLCRILIAVLLLVFGISKGRLLLREGSLFPTAPRFAYAVMCIIGIIWLVYYVSVHYTPFSSFLQVNHADKLGAGLTSVSKLDDLQLGRHSSLELTAQLSPPQSSIDPTVSSQASSLSQSSVGAVAIQLYPLPESRVDAIIPHGFLTSQQTFEHAPEQPSKTPNFCENVTTADVLGPLQPVSQPHVDHPHSGTTRAVHDVGTAPMPLRNLPTVSCLPDYRSQRKRLSGLSSSALLLGPVPYTPEVNLTPEDIEHEAYCRQCIPSGLSVRLVGSPQTNGIIITINFVNKAKERPWRIHIDCQLWFRGGSNVVAEGIEQLLGVHPLAWASEAHMEMLRRWGEEKNLMVSALPGHSGHLCISYPPSHLAN